VIWKLVACLPHFFVLAFLMLGLVVVLPISWLAILFTGRFPRALHGYVAGVLRWALRVQAYVLSLTDEFPPFSLWDDAGPAGRNIEIMSFAVGTLGIAGFVAVLVAFFVFAGQDITRDVSYQRLVARELTVDEASVTVPSGVVRLTAAKDPADDVYAPLLRPQAGHRFIEFELLIENQRGEGEDIEVKTSSFSLRDSAGRRHDPLLALVAGKLAPAAIASNQLANVRLAFELALDEHPLELRYNVLDYIAEVGENITYTFH